MLDENEKFNVFGFIAKYVIICEGVWRERIGENMEYGQVKSVN